MKKYAMRARIATARAVRPKRSARSGSRDSGDRSRIERSPRVVRRPASMPPLRDWLAVAGQAGHLGLRVLVQPVGQRRVLQLRRHLLASPERVVEPVLDPLGLLLRFARLAH